ncbi:transcription factor Cys6 [Fusarium acutatum]|uniref:Transcription factor Cys6 n=1 Tax=Fusarium acutatum TaxID=78861 RepID=A0A8H4J9Z9_9HYPO|nr:transcription factor Cys6 [Fusarium acutatum]
MAALTFGSSSGAGSETSLSAAWLCSWPFVAVDNSEERMPIAHNVRNVLNHEVDSPDDQAESHSLRELLSGPASLDHRLREAPHIQDQVLYLLRDISESLEDIIALIPQKEHAKGIVDIEDKPGFLPQGSESVSEDSFIDSDLDDDENNTPKTRLSTLCTDIVEAIDCLLRLSLAIANPASHERFRKLGAGPDKDVSFYEAHDVRYVQDKFPKISQDLPNVLSKFITTAGASSSSWTEVVPDTMASSLPEHLKASGVIDEGNQFDIAMSETSYGTSASYLMLKNGDLRPYTCLFSRCAESNTNFDRRHRWQLHVSQYHWRTWSCPFKCGSTYPSAVELGDHIRLIHVPNASDEHLATVVARGKVSVSNDVTKEGPGCKRAISGLMSYIKHVERHLEQLALHALTKIGDEELEDDVESGEQND